MLEEKSVDFVKWFSELNKNSGNVAGGKGANLAEIYNLKIPVPAGFVVTAQAYDCFIEKAGIKKQIQEFLSKINYEDTKQLDETTKQIRELILKSKFPKEMEEEILESYEHLDVKDPNMQKGPAMDILKTASEPVFVAVRSSATAEDLADASFAGQQDSFVNVKGKTELLEHVRKCFASLFTARATYYRYKKGFENTKVSLAVVVQDMVDSDKSGVIFSKDPSYNNDNVHIEAVWGLGEGIVSGRITPDIYTVDRELKILDTKIANKKIALTRDSGGGKVEVKLKEEISNSQVLKQHEIKKLADIAIKLEEHFKKPQDIEFAIERGEIYIVQTRPITTMEKRIDKTSKELNGEIVLTGTAASPGIASGKIKIVEKLEDLQKITKGDILVTKMTNPDMVVTMQKSAAIVTDEGGLTAHAAIVSREMGIPCFSGKTNILTNKGFMSMEEVHKKIKAKEKLLTLSFNLETLKTEWKRVKNTSKRKGKTITTSISKNGKVEHDLLRTTPEHKFFNLENRAPQYKEIKKILENNKIVYANLYSPKLNIKNNFNNTKAYLCGAIFSDGYLRIRNDGSASTVFVQKNIPDKQKFRKTVKDFFKKTYDYKLKKVGEDYLYCYKQPITRNLIKTQENISSIILSCDKKSVLNYLAGFIDGDGNFIKKGNTIKISLDKKKPQILHSLIIACMRLGIVYRIKTEKNQYRFYICSEINLIKPYLNRLVIKNTKKVTGDIYLSSKDLFKDIPVSGRKGIKSFVKNNCLLSKEKIKQKVMPYLKDQKTFNELKKILNSDLRVLRIKEIDKTKSEFVFNIEVEKNNNYVVFSNHFSPIIVKNCVVGTQEATTKLKEGETITVDGFTGKVYKGKIAETVQKEVLPVVAETKTKIKVIVDLPSFAERAARSKIREVGLTRIEGIIAESGKHPNYFLQKNQMQDYEELIFKGVDDIAKYFDKLWVRTSDIRSDEFQNLKGAPEEKEANPMLGMHGIRYGLKNPAVLKSELKALKRITEKGKEIGLLLPQIISVEEVQQVKKFLQEINASKIKVGVMVETPAAVQLIRELCDEGIDFISFGTNDLTQYILAVDRGNEQVQELYNEMHPAVLHQLEYVIRVCKRNNVETSICGQAGSRKEMTKFLVERGIDSISVNADMAKEITEHIAEVEKELIKDTDQDLRQYQPEEKNSKQDFVKPQSVLPEETNEEDTASPGVPPELRGRIIQEIVDKTKEIIEDKRGEVPIIPGAEKLSNEKVLEEEIDSEQSTGLVRPSEVEREEKPEFEQEDIGQEESDSEEEIEEISSPEEFDNEPEFNEEQGDKVLDIF